jgi:glycolate oxidase FAD binding subunit
MEDALAQLRDLVLAAHAARAPLCLRGGGTKDFYGERLHGDVLDTRGHAGIVSYEPSELVIVARCGTSLSQITSVLDQHGQMLAFEPPRFGGDPSIGGVVATGLSGPRRANAGAARDFVLGATLLTAQGELLRFGGQVMKNVAGFDISRLLCGSLGILGLIADVSLKVLPKPRRESTLRFAMTAAEAVDKFYRWSGQPLPVSATCWHDGHGYVRLSGTDSAVRTAQTMLGGEVLDTAVSDDWWRGLRDQTFGAFYATTPRLWRLSLPSTATFEIPGVAIIEWAGALRWLASDAPANDVRAAASSVGGTAMLWRGSRDTTMFHPLDAANLALHRRLKQQFDPHGVFNRGRLTPEL